MSIDEIKSIVEFMVSQSWPEVSGQLLNGVSEWLMEANRTVRDARC